MDYPPSKEGGMLPMPSVFGGTEEDPPAATEPQNEPDPGQAPEQTQDEPGQTEEPPEQSPGQTAPAAVQITVNAGDSASTIADKLLAAGAITDKQAFLADVVAQGADSRLRAGTFTIPAGSSHLEIIAILVQ